MSKMPPLAQRLAVVTEFAEELRNLGPANFLHTDGGALFAHGHRRINRVTGNMSAPGLHLLTRQCADPAEPIDADGILAAGFQQVTLRAH